MSEPQTSEFDVAIATVEAPGRELSDVERIEDILTDAGIYDVEPKTLSRLAALIDAAKRDNDYSVAEAERDFWRKQGMGEALKKVLSMPTAKRGNQLAHLLEYKLGFSTCKTQRELAKRMRISAGRLSQILKLNGL